MSTNKQKTKQKARQRKRTEPEIDISEWESHFKDVLGQETPNQEQNRTPSNRENNRTETSVPRLDSPNTEKEVRQKNLEIWNWARPTN